MKAVKSKNTGIELLVFSELKKNSVRFTKHYKNVPGRPDVAIPRKKIAIFIDGDFWHGYRYPAWKEKISSDYWKRKIERNRSRDRRTFSKLRRMDWKVLRVWEHQLEKNRAACIEKIISIVQSTPNYL